MFSTMRGGAGLVTAMTLTLASSAAIAQESGAPARSAARPATYDAVVEGMTCKQHLSGRMDCDYRVGRSVRFAVAGVGQEDVVVSFVQADSSSEYSASIVPLHGCVVVKPRRVAGADSVANFAYVSPKTGRVYQTWAMCLSATRTDARGESKADPKSDPPTAAPIKATAPETKAPPPVKPPVKPPAASARSDALRR